MKHLQATILKRLHFAALAAAVLAVAGCHHSQSSQTVPQQLPPVAQPAQPPQTGRTAPLGPIPATTVPPNGVSTEDVEFIATHKPIATQTGFATWYTAAPGRKAANGEVFDGAAMTAAHRTLPMGSLIRVTNLQTGQSAAMRITDRGPFVEGRVIDMTVASAKATGVYRAGLARVKIDVYQTPKPITSGGRWCVQIGAFHSEADAVRLKSELLQTYSGANVIEFPGESSYWVRIRPMGDDRETATYIAQHLHPAEGKAFLTRLD